MLPIQRPPEGKYDDMTDDDEVADMLNIPRQQVNMPESVTPDLPRPPPPDVPYDGEEDSDNEVEDIPTADPGGDPRQRFLDEAKRKQAEEEIRQSSQALPTNVNLRRLRNGTLFAGEETVVLLEIRALLRAAESVGMKVSDFTQDDVRKFKLKNLARLGDRERASIIAQLLRRNQPKPQPKPKPPPPPDEGKHDTPNSSAPQQGTKRKREDESNFPAISRGQRQSQKRKKLNPPERGANKRKAEDESNIPDISKGRNKRRKK
jgi:hypothetical protein